jgi:putative DNA primase/helicase
VRSMFDEIADAEDHRRTVLLKHAMKSESAASITAMAKLAESDLRIALAIEELDRDPFLFNVKNGTLDLRTGVLRPHTPSDHITKIGGCVYDEAAECPRWLAFLDRIFAGEPELVSFVQRFVGYALTGDVSEQILAFFYVPGANGKSTLLETVFATMGSYAKPGAPGLLVAKRNEEHPTSIADLRGARLVTSVEVGDGKRFDEERVKQLTGGDTIKARHMREDFFSFAPTHKIIVAANHKPEVRGTDHAIWRRIRLVPFDVTIPDEEKDPKLPAKLRGELPGILRWAVEGCLEWQRNGLRAPGSVLAATEGYREEQDQIGRWLTESTITDADASESATGLYVSYSKWCDVGGERSVTQTRFGRSLGERGLQKERDASGRTIWRGVQLTAEGFDP